MKKFLLLLFLAAATFQLSAQKSIPMPNPPSLVVDKASVLADYDRDQLERKLVALDNSSSNQVAIIIVKTLNDQPIEDVAVNTFREWGIGDKKTRNGVLILVAVDDHKVRIEVGYGLEGAIPDITASNIIENDIKPAFRKGNYYGGLNQAVDDISKAAVGEYKIQRVRNTGTNFSGGVLIKFIFILVVVLFLVIRGGTGGGGGGGGLGWIAPMLLLNSMGGGRSSGGDWGGGGGGGFGGFGGGGSGGGGASGGW